MIGTARKSLAPLAPLSHPAPPDRERGEPEARFPTARGRSADSPARGGGKPLLLTLILLSACRGPSEVHDLGDRRSVRSETLFSDRTRDSGVDFVHLNGRTGELYFVEMMGAGCGVFDYDGDGDLDLYLVQGGPLGDSAADPPADRLYRNDGGLRFTDVTDETGLRATGYGMGVAAGDYDNDGRVDLYLTSFGRNQLWRNRGDGTFAETTEEAGVGEPRWSVAASFFDFDRDGWLDLYVGNYVDYTIGTDKECYDAAGARDYCAPAAYRGVSDRLFRNRGDGTFEDVSLTSGVGRLRAPGLGAVTADWDGDGRLDLYVANDGEPNFQWHNRGDGTFSDVAGLAGSAVDEEGRPQASMGVAAADADNDGDVDLFLSHLTGETNVLYVNDGTGDFRDAGGRSRLGNPSYGSTGFGTSWLDYDNDGRLDVLVVNGAVKRIEALAAAGDPFPLHQRKLLFRNEGPGPDGGPIFADMTDRAGPAFALSEVGRGAAFGDLDNDGDADVLVSNNGGRARIFVNEVGSRKSWIGLRLITGGRDALGAGVAVERPGRPTLWRRARSDGSYASASDPRILVGLDDGDGAVDVRVLWPDGGVEVFGGLETRRYHALRQGRVEVLAVSE